MRATLRPRLPRTLVLGFDGASPQLLFPWARSGKLPRLGRLLRGCQSGHLRSTLPPMTLPAWSSFLTGASPGEHGIFDFCWPDVARERLHLVDARHRAIATIPKLLSDRGYHVGTFLFPTTWPPEPLSGGQVSGFDSPVAVRVSRQACSSAALHRQINQAVGGELRYSDFPEFRKRRGWQARALRSLLGGIEAKEKMALALLSRGEPYDFFALLFGESDTAAHHFWHLCDPASPRHDERAARGFSDALLKVYQRLDQALGALLDAGRWESVIVASDHGFGGSSRRVLHLAAFLEQQGFLRFRAGSASALVRHGRTAIATWAPPALLDRAYRLLPQPLFERLEWSARYGQVDMQRSLFWSEELNYAPSVRLNPLLADALSAGEREAALTALEQKLRSWRDPLGGNLVVGDVHRRESLYPGPCVGRAPEIYLELAELGGYSYNVLPSKLGDPPVRELADHELQGAKGAGMPGSHRRDGIFLLQAPGLLADEASLSIDELLPRWLELVGLDEILADRARSGIASPVTDSGGALSAGLTSRLRRLGYL